MSPVLLEGCGSALAAQQHSPSKAQGTHSYLYEVIQSYLNAMDYLCLPLYMPSTAARQDTRMCALDPR
jgi:hypothetical protein